MRRSALRAARRDTAVTVESAWCSAFAVRVDGSRRSAASARRCTSVRVRGRAIASSTHIRRRLEKNAHMLRSLRRLPRGALALPALSRANHSGMLLEVGSVWRCAADCIDLRHFRGKRQAGPCRSRSPASSSRRATARSSPSTGPKRRSARWFGACSYLHERGTHCAPQWMTARSSSACASPALTVCPAATRFAHMGNPIRPTPTNPTRVTLGPLAAP